MKNARRILSILMTCVMLLMAFPFTVSAAGTQDDPIDAATKWFGYGVDTYLLNPTITEGVADGIWYTLTAENEGVLFLEHSYKNVDYTIYITLNGKSYVGGCVDGNLYNRPIITAPIAIGDVATIQIVTKDAAAGTIYASMNVIAGDVDNAIKVKSDGLTVVVGAGETVYFQDDSLNAIYATKGLLVTGNVADTTLYTVTKNSENGTVITKPVTDSDADGVIEVMLGGSLGSAGAPPVKPGWAIENSSDEDQWYTLTIANAAHECHWDNDTDTDCNTCGAIREVILTCQHEYENNCDADCDLCGEVREDVPHNPTGNYPCNTVCSICWADLTTAEHTYSFDMDPNCDVCGTERDLDLPFTWGGSSISEDVHGLACRYNIQVEGLTTNGTTAVYDNATFADMKLVSMGAVVCNNFMETSTLPTLEDVDGQHVLDIPAKNLCSYNKETGAASYAIRIINIPDESKDTYIAFVPYVIVEDAEGYQHTLYLNSLAYGSSYNVMSIRL